MLASISPAPNRDRLRPIFNVQALALPPQIRILIHEWSANQSLPPLELSHVGAYHTILDCLQGPEDPRKSVVRRLHMCVIHLLRLEFEATTTREQNDQERFTQELILNRGYDQTEVSHNITRWSSAGSAFRALCQALGGNGILLLLPGDVSRTV